MQPLRKDSTSLEGFEDLFDNYESSDQISKNIHAILKTLVDDRIELKKEHHLVQELKDHINNLENKIQRLNWQIGQREQELSMIHEDYHKLKIEKQSTDLLCKKLNDLQNENLEIRKLSNQLSSQIFQEKAKNEMLIELLKEFKKPELKKIEEKLGI